MVKSGKEVHRPIYGVCITQANNLELKWAGFTIVLSKWEQSQSQPVIDVHVKAVNHHLYGELACTYMCRPHSLEAVA